MFGQFSYLDMQNVNFYVAPIYLTIFLVVIAIIFVNLMVAILAVTLSEVTVKAKTIIYNRKIDSIFRLQYDSRYGCLVATHMYLSFLNFFYFIARFVLECKKLYT
jgi:FtsH-binding integral membrane protein